MADKWINIEEDKRFLELIKSIAENKSNAVNGISYLAGNLLVEHGYIVTEMPKGHQYRWIALVDRTPVKRSKIVSTGRKSISKEKVEEIKKMRLEGHSKRSIARMVGVSEGTVRNYTKGL